ncbi:hypothetical protein [Cardinium endosymbiont of Bemisia tabaci]|uniref:hypothetical protein n=1 Tax=Cardinium endosymbiont of Bemisia tabaci TaxID=672794 RepID=UPI000553200C|nr:hypothetical protein [Cardinium endosymbiont of Bemisia tabaci]
MRTFFKALSLKIKPGTYDRLNKVEQATDESAYINSYNGSTLRYIAMLTSYSGMVECLLRTPSIKMGIKNSKRATKLKITKNPKKNE